MDSTTQIVNGPEVITIENEWIRCKIVPSMGGKIVSIYNKKLQKEFLWSNSKLDLQQISPGSAYDSNFWGGIDELLPNDIPEVIDGIELPDHGELWTTPLQYLVTDKQVKVFGVLPLCGLYYEKALQLESDSAKITMQYRIINRSGEKRHFMWKLHAALKIAEGDELETDARKAKVADISYSRFSDTRDFQWPWIEDTDASIIPPFNNQMDFFYLFGIEKGEMQLNSIVDGTVFGITYDKAIFPFQWIFSSYGGFASHYTAILEPCSTMPISVNDAKYLQQCSVLEPGEEINTSVVLYAGLKN